MGYFSLLTAGDTQTPSGGFVHSLQTSGTRVTLTTGEKATGYEGGYNREDTSSEKNVKRSKRNT